MRAISVEDPSSVATEVSRATAVSKGERAQLAVINVLLGQAMIVFVMDEPKNDSFILSRWSGS